MINDIFINKDKEKWGILILKLTDFASRREYTKINACLKHKLFLELLFNEKYVKTHGHQHIFSIRKNYNPTCNDQYLCMKNNKTLIVFYGPLKGCMWDEHIQGGSDFKIDLMSASTPDNMTTQGIKRCSEVKNISLATISAIAAISSLLLPLSIVLVMWLLFRRCKKKGGVPTGTNFYYDDYSHQMLHECRGPHQEGQQHHNEDKGSQSRIWGRPGIWAAPTQGQ